MRLWLIVGVVLGLMLGGVAGADGAVEGFGPPRAITGNALVEDGYAVVLGYARHDQGLPVYWRFKWGRSEWPYEHVTEASEGYALNGNHPVGFESVLRPLQPDTTYHYRAIAFTAAGKSLGRDRTFHTPPSRAPSN